MSRPPPDDDDQRTRVVVPPTVPATARGDDADPGADVAGGAGSAASGDNDDTRTVIQARPPASASAAASSAGDSGNALPVGTYLSEFELTGVIGEGGFGIVYLAWDHSLQRKVALKEYMPASLAARENTTVRVRSARHKETFDAGLKSFINEARLLAQFDHPSLVKVYRFWEANGTAYMVMPLYEGTTLKDTVAALPQRPDEAWLMGLLAPLTEALAVIHAENCFHRDIAPDNVILLAGSQRPLLLDFGAARRVISDMTQALTVILKPGYAPIEQYAESPDMKQGAWTDVYALAATVHWIVTGKTPPPSVSRLMTDNFEPLSSSAAGQYSERFLQAIDRALRVRPEDRTPSIDAFREDLGLPPAGASGAAPSGFGGLASGFGVPPSGFGNDGGGATLRVDGARSQPGAMPRTAAPAQPRPAAGAAPAGHPTAGGAAPAAGDAKPGRSSLWIGVGAAVLAIGVAAGYFVLGGSPGTPPAGEPAATAPSSAGGTDASPPTAAAPAVAAPAPPATPAGPPPFDLPAQIDRLMASQTPDFIVRATPARPQLRIGRDQVSFDVTSNRDGHLQVLLRGPDGTLYLFFPNDKATDTRIRAGQRVTLPQASWPLDTTEPAGSEQFIVVVSDSPRSYADFGDQREYIFQVLPTDGRAAALAANWPHATPLLLGAPARDCQGPRCDAYGAATFSIEVLR
jgi:hypothetical protein